MKIVICAISAILAAVLMTGPFDARDDGGDPEEAAGQRESPADAVLSQPAPEPETERRLAEQQAPRLAEPQQEQALAPQGQTREAAGEWQVVRQRPRDVGRDARSNRHEADLDQLAKEQEAQREALLQQQAQQLERFVELQRRQYEQLLEQQEQARSAATQRPEAHSERYLRQTGTQDDAFPEQRERLEPNQDFRESYGYDNRPQPDPYPDDGTYQGEFDEPPADSYRADDRRYRPDRRDTLEIPLPGGRRLRFRLW